MTEAELKEIEAISKAQCENAMCISQAVLVPKLIAEIRRLQKERADAPTCFGNKSNRGLWCFDEQYLPVDTHTAKLIDIKKIGEGE